MQAIYLTGLMGAGKTTVGKELASKLGLIVMDTDEQIVKQEGKSINEIFALHGESYFRELESKMLAGLPTENIVITTGGGIILAEENRKFMKERGTVVYLDANPEEILVRLQHDQSRPLLAKDKQNVIFLLYKDRLPLYEESCHLKITTTGKDIEAIVNEIIACF
ncbi:shikimate kinase [Bacillus sp. T3]|uniref:shikimate kinase n=1 Tax=Bacillus sp. T3 TaxID=467262 RepID=UPI00298218AD|nr:shikimate kinase [Bacillus sp. T3]